MIHGLKIGVEPARTIFIRLSPDLQDRAPVVPLSWTLPGPPALSWVQPRSVYEGDAPPYADAEVEGHPGDLRPPLFPGKRDHSTRPGILEPLAEGQVLTPTRLVGLPPRYVHGDV